MRVEAAEDLVLPDGRVFYHLTNIPHTRKDGSEMELAVWHSECTVCKKPFSVTTPAPPFASTKAFLAKHCADHRAARSKGGGL